MIDTVPYAALRALPAAVDNQEHSSGFLGFIVVFVLALAVYLLVRNLTARLRRMNYRHEHDEVERAGRIVTGGSGDGPAPAGGSGPRDRR
ncbi:MAG: hypothetical protein IPH03_17385 [Tetrasphaera sp.]|jgi:hypothetical protein|nr:hypothetical protein [Tetrasphaera sp.]